MERMEFHFFCRSDRIAYRAKSIDLNGALLTIFKKFLFNKHPTTGESVVK